MEFKRVSFSESNINTHSAIKCLPNVIFHHHDLNKTSIISWFERCIVVYICHNNWVFEYFRDAIKSHINLLSKHPRGCSLFAKSYRDVERVPKLLNTHSCIACSPISQRSWWISGWRWVKENDPFLSPCPWMVWRSCRYFLNAGIDSTCPSQVSPNLQTSKWRFVFAAKFLS